MIKGGRSCKRGRYHDKETTALVFEEEVKLGDEIMKTLFQSNCVSETPKSSRAEANPKREKKRKTISANCHHHVPQLPRDRKLS